MKKAILGNNGVVFILSLLIATSLIFSYGTQSNYNQWSSGAIQNQYREWQPSNIINIITYSNNTQSADFSLGVFNWNNNRDNNVEVEPLSIIKLSIGYNINALQNIATGSKVIIQTELPQRIVENYITSNKLDQKYCFIIFSKLNEYALVHSYFYRKNTTNSTYYNVRMIGFNCITENQEKFKELIKYYIDSKEKVVFYIKSDSINPDYLFKI